MDEVEKYLRTLLTVYFYYPGPPLLHSLILQGARCTFE